MTTFSLLIFVLNYYLLFLVQIVSPIDEDSGTPLFLTPYVENGQIREGRQLARVSFTESLLQIKSYSGFFTVNRQYNSNHFFWYFPAINPTTKPAPLIVWLSGGPGDTCFLGIFQENGPLRVVNDTLFAMNYTLAQEHNVVYIENPVGVGFSFTNDSKGYCTDQVQVGEQLYSSVTQFLKLFPKLQKSEMYVFGLSYGGKYAPALAYTIHKKNENADLKINLKGVIIADGLSDPVNQLQYGEYLYQLGLIDWNQAKVFEEYQNKITKLIIEKRWQEAITLVDDLINKRDSVFYNMTGLGSSNYLLAYNTSIFKMDFVKMVPSIRKSLHAGDLEFYVHSKLVRNQYLKHDIMKSVAPWISEILDHYELLVYNGQFDILVAYPITVNYLRKLNFSGAEEYKTAERHIWRVDGEVAGYTKRAGNLVEAMVRNAGHAAATDQPKWVLSLISDFIYGNI